MIMKQKTRKLANNHNGISSKLFDFTNIEHAANPNSNSNSNPKLKPKPKLKNIYQTRKRQRKRATRKNRKYNKRL